MKMILSVAWRNIWRNPVRSLVIIASVVIGLWSGACINAMYYGMSEDRVRIAIENEVSHIQIHHPDFKQDYKAAFFIQADSSAMQSLIGSGSIAAYSVRSVAQAMLSTTAGSSGVMVYGVDPLQEDATTHLASKMVDGQYFTPGKSHQILIGQKLANRLKLKVKSKVVISCLDTAGNITSGAFKIAGIYRSGNSSLDGVNVFVNRSSLNPMLELGSEAHEVAILLKSNTLLESTRQHLQAAMPSTKVETWKEISPETNLIVTTMSQFSVIFIVIILLALSFGIVNTMLMAILERRREIGMMMALGMNRIRIFFLILIETFMLVMVGCPPGLLIAWATITYFSRHGIDISSFAGNAMANFGFGTVMYPSLPTSIYIQIILMVAVCALLSAIFPAMKAIRLNPAETMKR